MADAPDSVAEADGIATGQNASMAACRRRVGTPGATAIWPGRVRPERGGKIEQKMAGQKAMAKAPISAHREGREKRERERTEKRTRTKGGAR